MERKESEKGGPGSCGSLARLGQRPSEPSSRGAKVWMLDGPERWDGREIKSPGTPDYWRTMLRLDDHHGPDETDPVPAQRGMATWSGNRNTKAGQ